MKNITSRQTAIQKGDKRYVTFCKMCGTNTEHVVKNWAGCVPCKRKYARQYNLDNKESKKKRDAQYYIDNIEKIKKYGQTEDRRKSKIKAAIKHKYNINGIPMTPEDWLRIYYEQGGICLTPSCSFTNHPRWWEQSITGFHIHHDHDTNDVIGLLCYGCNTAEGFINKDPIRTQELIEMKRHYKSSCVAKKAA